MLHSAHGHRLQEAGSPTAASPLSGSWRRTSSSSAAASPVSGRRGTWSDCSRRRASSCSRPTLAARARAAATAASATRCRSRWRLCGSAGETSRRCPSPGRRRQAWRGSAPSASRRVSTPGFAREASCRSRRAGPRRRHRAGARRLWRAWRRRPAGRSPRPRRRPVAPRRSSAPARSSPAGRRCSRPASRSACASACGRGESSARVSPVLALRDGATGQARFAAARVAPAPRCGDRRRRRRQDRCAAGSASPPPTSFITGPVPDLLEQVGWIGSEAASSTAAPWSTTSAPPRTGASSSAGRRADRDGGAAGRPRRARCRGRRRVAAHLHAFFPGLAGRRHHPRLGGPIDASPTHLPRSSRSPAAAPSSPPVTPATASAPPTWSAHPRLAGSRRARRALPPGLRRPVPTPRPARALPVDRRRSHPRRPHQERGGRACRSAPRPHLLNLCESRS